MALLNSENISLESPAPDFNLRNAVDGKHYSLQSFQDQKVLVVLFICVHCPYVQAVEDRLLKLAKDFKGKGVQFVAICANDPSSYPEDRPENIKKHALQKEYSFPYLVDETQEVAKAYGAVCTPDIYVYGPDRKLTYHGRVDDNWKDPTKVTRQELQEAIQALISGKSPSPDQHPSMGCSIKWKKL